MPIWSKWFLKNGGNRGKKRKPKTKEFKRLGIEALEERLTPAEVQVSSLLFRGDLLENNGVFSVAASAVDVGYNPAIGESFRPLVRLNGNTVIDPGANQFQFQGNATFSGMAGPIGFWSSATLTPVNVLSLIGDGHSITGNAFNLGDLKTTATTVAFVNPNGGDTSDSEIKLGGSSEVSFGTENNGTKAGTPLSVSGLQWTLTDPGKGTAVGKVSGQFFAAATGWTLQDGNYSSLMVSGIGTTTISGTATAMIRGNKLGAKLNGNGLSITEGVLTGLDAKISGPMTFAGCPGTITGLVSYANETLNFTGSGSINVLENLGPEGLFEYSDLNFTISQNTITALEGKSTTGIPAIFPLKGMPVFGIQMTSRLEAETDSQKESLRIVGTIGFGRATQLGAGGKQRDFELSFAGDGLVIRDGAIQDWDGEINGRLDLANNTLEARATRLWHKASDNSYGISGTLYLTLDKYKKFTDKDGKTVFSEPANFVSLDCGTKEKPGLLIVDGELRRLDVAVSTKNGPKVKDKDDKEVPLTLFGMTFRVNNLGIFYEATPGRTIQSWGLYGELSLNNRSTSLKLENPSQGLAVGISLGDRSRPGLFITSEWNQQEGRYDSKIEPRDLTFRMAGLSLGPFRISEAEFKYKTDPINPDLASWKITLACSFKGFMLGGSITFKDMFNENTNSYNLHVDAFSVKGGVDPGADKGMDKDSKGGRGFLIGAGVYLYTLEGRVENWQTPENLIITGIATFSIGPALPGVFMEDGKVINTQVHAAIVRGEVSFSSQKIWGNVDVFLVSYWDQANYGAGLEPWKPLAGRGTGTFLIDWTNNVYEVKFTATLISLVTADYHIRITDEGFLLYAKVQVKPIPYGPFDFWPLSGIDYSGSCLWLVTREEHVIGAWVQAKIIFFDIEIGVGYDFTKGDGFLMDSDDIADFMQLKDEFINGPKVTYSYTVQVPEGGTGGYASQLTATIPFSTTDITIENNTFAKALNSSDIEVEFSSGIEENPLPPGASFTYRVEMGNADSAGDKTGLIIVDIFPNPDKRLYNHKTFAMLGLDKLIFDMKVRVKQKSFFYYAGADQRPYLNLLKLYPNSSMKGLDYTKSGYDIYANATWDSAKRIYMGHISNASAYPVIPELKTSVLIADPTIVLPNDKLLKDKQNDFTNITEFSFQANASPATLSKGTASLLVLDDAEVLASRWLVETQGVTWFEGADGVWYSPGHVVERNHFTQSEMINRKADKPAVFDECYYRGIMYFDENGAIQIGYMLNYDYNDPQRWVIEPKSGFPISVDPSFIKPLFNQNAKVMLRRASPVPSHYKLIYEAANVPTGYIGDLPDVAGKSYYELFDVYKYTNYGELNDFTSDQISRDRLKLPTLPHFVTDKMAELGDNGLNQFFPINAASGLTTLAPGVQVPVVGLNGSTIYNGSVSSIIPLEKLLAGTTNKITWEETNLTPTPKWVYLMINDGLNPPSYSNFERFNPGIQVTGKALLADSKGVVGPYHGLTVYLDTNLNGRFDSPEAFDDKNFNGSYDLGEPFVDFNANTVRDAFSEPSKQTNSRGEYYFYNVAAGAHTIGFDLPSTLHPSGPASMVINRGITGLATAPDFTATPVYPIVQGRVIVDTNHNGKEDNGESGTNLVRVRLTSPSGQSLFTLTDDQGYYSIPVDDDSFGSTVTVSVAGDGLDSNLTTSSTQSENGSQEITSVDFLKPRVYTSDFFVQSNYEFKFDANASPFENIFNNLKAFLNGKYTGISFSSGGLEFHVDQFKLLPYSFESQGLESARGRVVFNGQTLNYELKGPRGLVANGPKLLELNAAFSGKFNIFGAKLDVDNLTVRYAAADAIFGTPARYMLSGSTTLEVDGNRVGVELPGNGLVLSEGGIQSLDIKLTGGLKVAGYEIDVETLAAVYNRATDRLTLSGSTKLLDPKGAGNFIGIENVVMELGGANNLGAAKVLRFEGTVAAGLSLEGVSFSVDKLTVRYLPDQAELQILGQSTLVVGNNTLEVDLLAPGTQFAQGELSIHAIARGQLVAGNYTFQLDNSSISYSEASLKFSATTSLNVGEDRLALGSGEILWKSGAIARISGKVSGNAKLGTVTVELENLDAVIDTEKDTVKLNGSFKVGLLSDQAADQWVRVIGSIELVAGKVVSASGKAESGTWEVSKGFELQLTGLNFVYSVQEQYYQLSGACDATFLGGKVGVSIAEPGLVWRNGDFESFGGGLTGSLAVDIDQNNKNDLELAVDNLGFLYQSNPRSLTIQGGIKARLDGPILAGGELRTDDQGIVFGANGLEHFSLVGSIGANFGESFTDNNKNFIKDSDESFTDANGNGKYDFGLGFYIRNADFSYSQAQNESPAKLHLSGAGFLAFDLPQWEINAENGVSVDLTNPGIDIVDGQIMNFSVVVGANFRIGGLDFEPDGKVGLRYLSEPDQWDLFGHLKANISEVGYGLTFGDSFDKPGIQWVHGSITHADAVISGSVRLANVEATLKDSGLMWESDTSRWGVYGAARVKAGVWLEASLGTRANPGLWIDTSKAQVESWALNGLEIGFGSVHVGGFQLSEIRFGFQKIEDSFSVVATCGLTINGWGLGGKFAFKDGVVNEIFVEANTVIPIPGTPLFINQLNGSIQDLDFLDLSKLTFTSKVGIAVGTSVDLSGVPIIGGKYALAQFFGTAVISPNGLRVQADAYLLAKEDGVIGNKKWRGLLGQGTANISLDWSKNEYFAEVDLRANDPTESLFEIRLKGRMTFNGNGEGLQLQADGSLVLGKKIPVLGELEIGGANFSIELFPKQERIAILSWFTYKDPFHFFQDRNAGILWDLWNQKLSVLDDKGVKAHLGEGPSVSMAQAAMGGFQTMTQLPPAPSNNETNAAGMSQRAASVLGNTYLGETSAVPDTQVMNGRCVAQFRVDDPALKTGNLSWISKINFEVEPEPGVTFEPIPATFDPVTGIGSMGVRVLPPAGQYLPRGMVLNSKLTSEVPLAGTNPEKANYNAAPDLEATWTRAFAYSGDLPAIGTDAQGQTITNLNVTRARYLFSFKPQIPAGTELPTDWLQSIRVYVEPIPGATAQVGTAFYDAENQLGSLEVVFKPTGSTVIGGKYISSDLVPKATIWSNLELLGEDDTFGSIASPDVTGIWWAEPSEINAPIVPPTIVNDLLVTRLTGRVHDPRFEMVEVGLFYSLDEPGELEFKATLANGDPAIKIPATVQPDGSWSVDIQWDPSKLPSGDLWLYGWVDDDGPNPPIYGDSTKFTHKFDIEGTVTSPSEDLGSTLEAFQAPVSGLRVFGDLNNNGQEDIGEPVSITDADGHYFMDVNGAPGSLLVHFVVPSHYATASGFSPIQVVDLSQGSANAYLQIVPTRNILRGRVMVTGALGQAVSGIGVIATGGDGSFYRVTTDIRGFFEIPVAKPGEYEVKPDLKAAEFFGFRIQALEGVKPHRVQAGSNEPEILRIGDILVDSVGIVSREGENAQGTLEKLVRQANEGFVTTIQFDDSLRGKTLALTGSTALLDPSYILWNTQAHSWTFVPPMPPLGPDGKPVDSYIYGPSAFRIEDDLRIDGGNLGITLQGDGASRAFHVRPEVDFRLENLTLTGFAALGANGQPGFSSFPDLATGAGGGGAGLGGAILNQGQTIINNVQFLNNSAVGGNGGDASLPAPDVYSRKISIGGLPLGQPGGKAGMAGMGGGYLGGLAGQPITVAFDYSVSSDPTTVSATAILSAAGGGGSGLGGAIYNAPASNLTIAGNTIFNSNRALAGQGGGSPELVTNLANALVGDEARTLAEFVAAADSKGKDGSALGQALFNDGGKVTFAPSVFRDKPISEMRANIQSVGGIMVGMPPTLPPDTRPVVASTGNSFSLMNTNGSWEKLSSDFTNGAKVKLAVVDSTQSYCAIAAPGPGDAPMLKVMDLATGQIQKEIQVFDSGFKGGVFMDAADIDGDGMDEILVGAGPGGGPHVKLLRADGSEILSFFAFSPEFRGGASVAFVDVNNDGAMELVVAAGPGGGPHVKIFSSDGTLLNSFWAFDIGFKGGVFVAGGDLGGDDRQEIILTAGPRGGPVVRILDANSLQEKFTFIAYDPDFLGGVRASLHDYDMDGRLDLITGAGPGGGPHVKIFDGRTLDLIDQLFAADVDSRDGVFV